MRFANSDAPGYSNAMNFRLPICAVLFLALLPLHAEETVDDAQKKKKKNDGIVQDGWLKNAAKSIWPFGKKPNEAQLAPPPPGSQAGKEWKQLLPTITLEPLPLQLSAVRTVKVTLRLGNKGKKLAQLDFPTSQRIEVLVKDATGKRIEQWSEDQAFENEPSIVTINPLERVEYTATVSTRDMKAGQAYTVEAFFPNYDQLRASKQVTPIP